jgi:Fe-S-cluster containining protein
MTGFDDWETEGLRFECRRSGNCCTGAPGAVRLTEAELASLARELGGTPDGIRRRYTRTLPDGALGLRELPGGACVLYDPVAGCTAYRARPRQCRTWPFWRSNLASRAAWGRVARGCPGIGRGPRVPPEQIRELAAEDGTSAPPS